MAIRLHRIELGDSPAPERASGALGEQDRILSAELMAYFTSLAAVDGSFLPEIGAPDPDNARRRTLGSFYDLIQSGSEALELLISSIEALLARPGEGFSELSGHWIVVLLEVSILFSPQAVRLRPADGQVTSHRSSPRLSIPILFGGEKCSRSSLVCMLLSRLSPRIVPLVSC